VADLRNSKVAELHAELAAAGAELHVHDPRADAGDALREYGIRLERWEALPRADALILAVAHREYTERRTEEFLDKVAQGACVLDIKGVLDLRSLKNAGCSYWRL
jgi:UDP-N-acetyl-D-galactosamine dehydrogenase